MVGWWIDSQTNTQEKTSPKNTILVTSLWHETPDNESPTLPTHSPACWMLIQLVGAPWAPVTDAGNQGRGVDVGGFVWGFSVGWDVTLFGDIWVV